jgi:hypothetical protein
MVRAVQKSQPNQDGNPNPPAGGQRTGQQQKNDGIQKPAQDFGYSSFDHKDNIRVHQDDQHQAG